MSFSTSQQKWARKKTRNVKHFFFLFFVFSAWWRRLIGDEAIRFLSRPNKKKKKKKIISWGLEITIHFRPIFFFFHPAKNKK